MKKIKVNKKWIASLAAVALLAAGFNIPSLQAADSIDLDKTCSLTISVDSGTEYGQDLLQDDVAVDLKAYKVADVSKDGTFEATGIFKDLELVDLKTDTKDWKDTVSEAWKEVSAEASDILKESEDKGQAPEADASTTLSGGTGLMSDLPVGLYLVVASDADSETYTYKFTPYLISLPGNVYRQTGSGEDAWIYDVEAGLKPERSERYGSLKIVKTVTNFDTTKGRQTFVFQVDGTKDGELVYSNVVSIDFDGSELPTREAVLDKLPVGCDITVTEVYSGASYTTSGDAVVNPGLIVADQVLEADFSNTENDDRKGGFGTCNKFEYSKENQEWSWSRMTDSSSSASNEQ